nr:GapR family DNA-binding domain-containing protein [Rhodovulum sulfidophilum]
MSVGAEMLKDPGAAELAVDPLTVRAAQHIVESRKASVSNLQAVLRIGFSRAAGLMEALEAEGIVTAADHVGRREVAADVLPPSLAVLADGPTVSLTGPNGATTGPIPLDTFTAPPRPPMKETAEDEAVRNRTYRVVADELRGFIERFETLAEEKAAIGDQQKAVMAEAKARGYDTKALRRLIALRKRHADDIAEEEAVLQLYREALGM